MNLAIIETSTFPSAFLAMGCGYECWTMISKFYYALQDVSL